MRLAEWQPLQLPSIARLRAELPRQTGHRVAPGRTDCREGDRASGSGGSSQTHATMLLRRNTVVSLAKPSQNNHSSCLGQYQAAPRAVDKGHPFLAARQAVVTAPTQPTKPEHADPPPPVPPSTQDAVRVHCTRWARPLCGSQRARQRDTRGGTDLGGRAADATTPHYISIFG